MKAERRDYNPTPAFAFNAELQPVFALTEGVSDMVGRNASDEELIAAKAMVTRFINTEGNE